MRKELFAAGIIYFVTMITLLLGIYRYIENWQLSTLNVFVAGALVLLVAMGWGYVLTALIFAPSKKMENTLTTLTNEIIHELNIPLSTIKANTEMLKRNTEDEKSLKRLERIDDASLRLRRLYDELVYTLSKEIHEIEKETFNVQRIVDERVAIFKEQERQAFEVFVEPYSIHVDKIGFEQILDNVITNAMKYSSKSSSITIALKEGRLSISDKGIGMTASELLRVHERYFQGNDATSGKGIGLSLVKAYCESENIEIQIQSEKDVGTEVILELSKVKKMDLTQN